MLLKPAEKKKNNHDGSNLNFNFLLQNAVKRKLKLTQLPNFSLEFEYLAF